MRRGESNITLAKWFGGHRRSHISCNSPSTPPDCISIVHSAMSRVIRKLRLPDYVERRDLRSLPGGLIDTDTSGNLKCVRVKVQPPLPSSPTFPGGRRALSLSLSLSTSGFPIEIAIRFAFSLLDETTKPIPEFSGVPCFPYAIALWHGCGGGSVHVRLLYWITQYSGTSINRTSIIRIFYYLNALPFENVLLSEQNISLLFRALFTFKIKRALLFRDIRCIKGRRHKDNAISSG